MSDVSRIHRAHLAGQARSVLVEGSKPGTFDGVASLALAAGIPVTEARVLMDQAKANADRLAACARHDFSIPLGNQPLRMKWQCSACGGVVDSSAKHWFIVGMAQAGA